MTLALVKTVSQSSLFTHSEIQQFEQSISGIPLTPSLVSRKGVATVDPNYRQSQQRAVPQHNPFVYKLMMSAVRANEQHFHFNIGQYLNQIDYVVYEQGCFFDWHTDPIPNKSGRQITTIVFLSHSSEYQGGKLYFKDPNKGVFRVDQEIGSVVHFNSTAMHTAKPVESGTRKVVVAWSG